MTLTELREKALARLSAMLDDENATVRLSAAKIALGAKEPGAVGLSGDAEAAEAAMERRANTVGDLHENCDVTFSDEEPVDAGDAEAEG